MRHRGPRGSADRGCRPHGAVIESWQARLLRLDLTDDVRIAPTPDEIYDLTARPDDPIIARVAAELVRRLEAGEAGGDLTANLAVVRQALHILHGLAHTTNTTSIGAANA